MTPPPLDSGEKFDKDIEAQAELDRKRLAKRKEPEPGEREKILAAFKKWIRRRREP